MRWQCYSRLPKDFTGSKASSVPGRELEGRVTIEDARRLASRTVSLFLHLVVADAVRKGGWEAHQCGMRFSDVLLACPGETKMRSGEMSALRGIVHAKPASVGAGGFMSNFRISASWRTSEGANVHNCRSDVEVGRGNGEFMDGSSEGASTSSGCCNLGRERTGIRAPMRT